jgi:hypothetical protein
MRAFILASLAAVSATSFAADATEIDLVFRNGDLTVRLTGDPCEIPLPLMAIPQVIPGAKILKAHVMAGRDQKACWAVDAEDDVLVVTEQGGGGWIPLKSFKATNGI